ncbi:unnamed protein product [Meloidogyne enterolobii]|uniref:Uncharacterized protein n=1 Tax=Meloidogyne enterolobii TaxID=390850 RepID=A0ACB0YG67_MELEN
MAINIANKKALIEQLLPKVEFNITANGLTISAADRISTPRFVPFDHAGRCRECKGSEVELDFIVTKEGVTCYCTRIKSPTFIPFDTIYELPGHCFFKIKNKGRIFNIEHGSPPCATIPIIKNIEPLQNEVMSPILPPSPKKIKQETLADESFENVLQEFFDNLGTTTTTSEVEIKKENKETYNQAEQEVKNREKRSTSDPPPLIEDIDNSPLSYRFKDAVNSQSF